MKNKSSLKYTLFGFLILSFIFTLLVFRSKLNTTENDIALVEPSNGLVLGTNEPEEESTVDIPSVFETEDVKDNSLFGTSKTDNTNTIDTSETTNDDNEKEEDNQEKETTKTSQNKEEETITPNNENPLDTFEELQLLTAKTNQITKYVENPNQTQVTAAEIFVPALVDFFGEHELSILLRSFDEMRFSNFNINDNIATATVVTKEGDVNNTYRAYFYLLKGEWFLYKTEAL